MTSLDTKVLENTMQEKDGILVLEDSCDLEKSIVLMMIRIFELEDPSSKDFDNLALRRFLGSRDQEVNKASKLFLKFLKWRKTYVPNAFMRISRVIPLLLYSVADTSKSASTSLSAKKFLSLESRQNVCQGHEKFVCIPVLKGRGYANCDIRGYSGGLTLLQDCYPERLDKLFLVHVPYAFAVAWKLVTPFIDDKTKKKFVFVEEKLLKETLLEVIEESQLPEIY